MAVKPLRVFAGTESCWIKNRTRSGSYYFVVQAPSKAACVRMMQRVYPQFRVSRVNVYWHRPANYPYRSKDGLSGKVYATLPPEAGVWYATDGHVHRQFEKLL